jgi:hypothetical protein
MQTTLIHSEKLFATPEVLVLVKRSFSIFGHIPFRKGYWTNSWQNGPFMGTGGTL